jgi:hypothetical protein
MIFRFFHILLTKVVITVTFTKVVKEKHSYATMLGLATIVKSSKYEVLSPLENE